MDNTIFEFEFEYMSVCRFACKVRTNHSDEHVNTVNKKANNHSYTFR